MTVPCSPTTHGADGGPISTTSRPALSPAEFENACRGIVTQHGGHEAHRLLDQLVTDLLSSLGYGEGMAVFIAHVGPFHPSAEIAAERREMRDRAAEVAHLVGRGQPMAISIEEAIRRIPE